MIKEHRRLSRLQTPNVKARYPHSGLSSGLSVEDTCTAAFECQTPLDNSWYHLQCAEYIHAYATPTVFVNPFRAEQILSLIHI